MSDITVNNFKAFYEQIRPYLGAAHSGFTPIGTVISVMGTTAPLNYLACDGTVYNISDYPELAAYFNQQFGSSNHFGGNGTTTFAVPDLRGEFLRGTGTNSHANQGSGANVGVHQDGSTVYCDYSTATVATPSTSSALGNYDFIFKGSANRVQKNDSVDNYNFGAVRPTNTSVLYCIASKNIFMDAGSNYSTEEQVVGTWIDGKPIYQKTIDCGALPNATAKDINHNITNLGDIIYYSGYAIQPLDNTMIILPFIHHQTMSENVSIVVNKTIVRIRSGANKSTYTKSYITLRYTKTT